MCDVGNQVKLAAARATGCVSVRRCLARGPEKCLLDSGGSAWSSQRQRKSKLSFSCVVSALRSQRQTLRCSIESELRCPGYGVSNELYGTSSVEQHEIVSFAFLLSRGLLLLH